MGISRLMKRLRSFKKENAVLFAVILQFSINSVNYQLTHNNKNIETFVYLLFVMIK